jgi:hypothetical protein
MLIPDGFFAGILNNNMYTLVFMHHTNSCILAINRQCCLFGLIDHLSSSALRL